MKNTCPQLLADIELTGKTERMASELLNAYFRGGWDDLLVWADENGVSVSPRSPMHDPHALIRLSKK
jgi:hypothetical protein